MSISVASAPLASGWNTWNNASLTSHVLLPAGLGLNLGFREYTKGFWLRETLVGRWGKGNEEVRPGVRTFDGGYTELHCRWMEVDVEVRTAVVAGEWYALVTPREVARRPAVLTVEVGLMWQRPGGVERRDGGLHAAWPGGGLRVGATAPVDADVALPTLSPCLACALDRPVGVFTGPSRTVDEIMAMLDAARERCVAAQARWGEFAEAVGAVQAALAWNTLYDAAGDRVITPVSRIWNTTWGGWILFEWDTYFAAWIAAALGHHGLAQANLRAMTAERVPAGFVPNFSAANGAKSLDRSHPPVGALALREVYRLTGDKALVAELFDALVTWHRWWPEARGADGLLCVGSNGYAPVVGNEWETPERGVGGRFGAALESGADNSPMYDDVPFDAATGRLRQQDVGVSALWVRDGDVLAELAEVLGRYSEAAELREGADKMRGRLGTLWDGQAGLFVNRRTDSGAFSARWSPTSFFPLLAEAATPAQADALVGSLEDPTRFGGSWGLPAIARADPAYPEQAYWRGRIWPPYNMLTYLALRQSGQCGAAARLAEKSLALFMKNWRERGVVAENFDAETGVGGTGQSDKFYHWGGLLVLPALIEAGLLPAPEARLAAKAEVSP